MSAFVVDKAHIDALVSVATFGPIDGESQWHGPTWAAFDPDETAWQDQVWRSVSCAGRADLREVLSSEITADELGEMLWRENVASVNYRYDESDDPVSYAFGVRGHFARPLAISCATVALMLSSADSSDHRSISRLNSPTSRSS